MWEAVAGPKVNQHPAFIARKFCIVSSGAVHEELLSDEVGVKGILGDIG